MEEWSIPAWAGETGGLCRDAVPRTVYPRVGGGNRLILSPNRATPGLSPRGRGKRAYRAYQRSNIGSIPAWAGETRRSRYRRLQRRVYPRVGGGNCPGRGKFARHRGLSPRGRGKRLVFHSTAVKWGSIPAWAGETGGIGHRRYRCGVYPRVGGGNF